MTCRQFYSDISSNIKAWSIDDWISPAFLISEGRSIVSDFLKKDHEANRHLARLSEGWGFIPCVKMKEISLISCSDIDIRLCDKIMRSEQKLPQTFTFNFGDIIKTVASVNYSSFFNPVTPRLWNSIQKRKFKDKTKYYFYFQDGYLYIPIPKGVTLAIEELTIEAYFKDKYEVYLFNLNDGGCDECKDTCPKPLDFEFVCPYYLELSVKKELLNRLANIYLKVTPDDYPDMSAEKTGQRDLQNGKNGLI